VLEIEDRHPMKRALSLPFEYLNERDSEFAAYLLEHPDEVLASGVEKLGDATQKKDVAIRITGLPGDVLIDISKLRAAHVGKLVSVKGLVRKTTAVKPNVKIAKFKCARCPATILEPQTSMILTEPLECYKDQDGCGRTASSTKFKLVSEACYTVDLQKIEVQEPPEGLRGGTQPGRITAYLSHEITGRIQPGMRATLNGILRMKVDGGREKSTVMETELDVLSYELDEGDQDEKALSPEEVEEIKAAAADPDVVSKMVRSIAPGIKGYDIEKESLLYQLVGGVTKALDDGQKMRGDIHILLVGDPGVGKSQLLHYMCDLAPRGVYASGKSSSNAGLTAAAVKDDFGEGRWVLEAGALVLADKGLACVDELDKMSEQDRSALHEAMEAQQITVAKAGIQATLQCRFSMLAGANPKLGRFDKFAPIATQIDLPPTLMSRFDLIFAIMDEPNKKRDEEIAKHVLRAHMRAGALRRVHDKDAIADEILKDTEDLKTVYNPEFVRRFVTYARNQVPVITQEVTETIVQRYLEIRQLGANEDKHTVPITARQLEAYVRLAEASAKMRLAPYVEKKDAIRAMDIVQYYLGNIASNEDGAPDIDTVMTGMSGSQRGRIQIIKELVRTLGPIAEADLLIECDGRHMQREEALGIIRRLTERGDIYEPKIGVFDVLR
jgi:replicative DNA helicase Mcm